MSGESFFSRILTAMGLKSSYESKHKTAYDRLDYKHLIPASIKGKCGYVNEFGEWIIDPQYDKCGLFADNGLAPIEVNEKFGYIDKTGSYVIKPTKFDWASPFGKNGLAVVSVFFAKPKVFLIVKKYCNKTSFKIHHNKKNEKSVAIAIGFSFLIEMSCGYEITGDAGRSRQVDGASPITSGSSGSFQMVFWLSPEAGMPL